MELRATQGDIAAFACDSIVVNLFEGVTHPGGGTGAVDRALDGAISHAIAAGDFSGKSGSSLLLYTNGQIPAARVLVVGLGPAADFDFLAARKAAGVAVTSLKKLTGVSTAGAILNGAGIGSQDPTEMARAFALGSQLAAYQSQEYPTRKERQTLDSLTLVEYSAPRIPAIEVGLKAGEELAAGVCFARDLVNEPPNILVPVEFARRAKERTEDTNLSCEVIGEAEMQRLGMGLILGVSQGSHQEAQLIILKHEPPGTEDQAPLVFIGKGITFDTGGISIKPSAGMDEMKTDMAGAAAVVGSLLAISTLEIPQKVFGLAVCVENMPGGNAYRPGDILTNIKGKTAEILNTDAEGRLVLSDCLGFVARYQPQAVIDLATLTGAIGIALGDQAAGLFSNDAAWEQQVVEAAAVSGDRVWPMPMYDEYADAIKSDMAQVKNSASRMAGVSSSAKFLEHFTEGYPWAHLDIAYMALRGKGQGLSEPKGASGYGVQLLTALAAGNKA